MPFATLAVTQFTRAIRKVVPSALSRCYAANFAHEMALSSSKEVAQSLCEHMIGLFLLTGELEKQTTKAATLTHDSLLNSLFH